MYNAYCGWRRARSTPGSSEFGFCRKNFLSPQTLQGIEDVKMQLVVSIADAGLLTLDSSQKTALNRYVAHPFLSPRLISNLSKSQRTVWRPQPPILHHPRRTRRQQRQRSRHQLRRRLELLPEIAHPRRQGLAQRRKQPIRHSAPDIGQQARRFGRKMALVLPHHASPQSQSQRARDKHGGRLRHCFVMWRCRV